MAAASETCKRVFLELGGKSAAIVLDDGDFDMAALFAAFATASHAGQGCAITTRLLVPRKHHDEIVEKMKNNFGRGAVRQPHRRGHLHGSADQREAARQGRRDGQARRRRRAPRWSPAARRWIRATSIRRHCSPTSIRTARSPRTRCSGRCWSSSRYDDDDDAVRIANNSIYGLSGAVFGSEDRALAVARRIRTGTFSINGGMYFAPTARSAVTSSRASAGRWAPPGSRSSWSAKTNRDGGLVSRDMSTAPLDGIRVLEVAMYGFVPSAGAVLAEWGADVIKVEHAVTGDPQRGLRQTGLLRVEGDPNPNIEHANRGKRSIGLDMSTPEGKEVLYELARRSDVFLTSFLPGHRKKFGIDVDDIRAVNPKIIYARGSALGPARRGVGQGRLRHDRLLVSGRHRGHHHPARYAGDDRPARSRPTATPSVAPTSQAASRPRCSSGSAPVSRRSWTSRCSAAGSGRWGTPSR